MVRFLVDRPIAILVSFFALLILGITAYLGLPVSLLPETNVPEVIVRVPAPDHSAQETEQRTIAPLRASLQQLRGLASIESMSSEGGGVIHLRFDYGTDIGMAVIEANEKVDLSMDRLPREAQRPIVSKTGISDIPIFRLNISPLEGGTNPRMAELSSFVREVVRRRIEQLQGVAMVDMTGLTQPQVEIIPKEGYLESLGFGEEALLSAFNENRSDLGNILVQDGNYRYFLRFAGGAQNLAGIGSTPLRINGRLFRLSDLATVTYTSAESAGAYYSKVGQAINIAVIMRSSARMDDLKVQFLELLAQMRRDYPEVAFQLTQDQTHLLDFAISNLQQDLLLGGLLAFLLMLVFIRKLRIALLIGITVPLSLLISQLGFHILGVSVNVISLGGLILGLSMILDNSIVVMDAIAGHRDRGMSVSEAAVAGTNEIIRPLIASVLTNCAVFIPLIFLSGLSGAIFYDQAVSIVVGVVSSLLVAIILLPPLYRLVHLREPSRERQWFSMPVLVNVTGWYDSGLRWSFRNPWAVTSLVVAFVVSGIVLFKMLEKQRLPEITRQDMEAAIDWNEPLDAREGGHRVLGMTTAFGAMVTDINIWAGRQQYLLPLVEEQDYSRCRLYLRVMVASALGPLQDSLARYVEQHYPRATLELFPARNAFDAVFADNIAPLQVKVSDPSQRRMPSLDTVRQVIASLRTALPHARINPVTTYEKIVLTTDPWQAARYGIDPQAVASRIKSVFKPRQLGNFTAAEAYAPILLAHPQVESVQRLLAGSYMQSRGRGQVPLSALVSLSRQEEYKYITAGTQGEHYPISIHTDRPEMDLEVVETVLAAYSPVLETHIGGSYFNNRRLIGEMALVFAISVMLLYFILAAQFESLLQPLFILAELPVAVCGALLLLYLGGNNINLMSMIGIVVMGGLIINDSILKIDAINRLRRQGMPLMEAIYKGGHRRLHSIVMISLTSIGALGPTLFMDDLGSELQQPLALTLIGGMVVGLLVSLFFLPIVYWTVYRKKEKL